MGVTPPPRRAEARGCAAFLLLALLIIGTAATLGIAVRVFQWITGN